MLSIEKPTEEAKCEDLVKVTIGDDPKKFFQIRSQLPQQEKKELIEFLKQNIDIFAWNTYEAPEVNQEFICHHLNVNPLIVPKKHPHRRPSKEHAKAVRAEVIRLKQVGAIKEVFYPKWLANTVVVKKKSGKWRICADFTDLNKACPQGSISYAQDRPVSRCYCWPSSNEFLRCFLGLSSNTIRLGRSREDGFRYSYWELPLQNNVIRVEERRIHLSENDDKNVQVAIGEKHRNLYR